MWEYRSAAVTVALVASLCTSLGTTGASAQVPSTPTEFGGPVYPAYEGWYSNPDGSYMLLVGYFNPNTEETVEVLVGEANFISPGPPDRGQPTIIPPGRGYGVFTIQVPADFGDEQLSWTLTANDQTVTVPMHLDPQWIVEPFKDAANGNEPPTIRFSPDGEGHRGPPVGIAHSLSGSVGIPVELRVWTTDVKPSANLRAAARFRRPALVLKWHLLRGPGDVSLSDPEQEFEASSDQNPVTTATFNKPGEYLLRVEALDETGEGGSGFQCCWTSAHVRVTVS